MILLRVIGHLKRRAVGLEDEEGHMKTTPIDQFEENARMGTNDQDRAAVGNSPTELALDGDARDSRASFIQALMRGDSRRMTPYDDEITEDDVSMVLKMHDVPVSLRSHSSELSLTQKEKDFLHLS